MIRAARAGGIKCGEKSWRNFTVSNGNNGLVAKKVFVATDLSPRKQSDRPLPVKLRRAVVAQPVTGMALVWHLGYPPGEDWIVLSILLYLLTGAFWLPVVWMQMEMRRLAAAAAEQGTPLPKRYHRLFRLWFAFGFPAFAAVLGIFWLMIARPVDIW